ncbi:MAG: hypothetical protein LC768_06555 [Acidobacteria bacterium]|nr:hypothetical protein [Acidobacteriota bacterium]MCA1637984.1 hypothetical protein [Acidobacteriota bacterium]
MKNKKVKLKETSASQESDVVAIETIPSELNEPRWSVVSFEKYLAKNLTYNEAIKKINKLKKQNVSGLCIITDEAAERITS